MAAIQVRGPWAKSFDLKLWSQAYFSGVSSPPPYQTPEVQTLISPKIKEKEDFPTKKLISNHDGGVGKHSLPPHKTRSKLQLSYRTTITQNHQK